MVRPEIGISTVGHVRLVCLAHHPRRGGGAAPAPSDAVVVAERVAGRLAVAALHAEVKVSMGPMARSGGRHRRHGTVLHRFSPLVSDLAESPFPCERSSCKGSINPTTSQFFVKRK
jgi:hypothetical protein